MGPPVGPPKQLLLFPSRFIRVVVVLLGVLVDSIRRSFTRSWTTVRTGLSPIAELAIPVVETIPASSWNFFANSASDISLASIT